ncbi:MAG: hypothetical protein ACK4VI_04960 [Alphaproteobacteria bacterium]
MLGKIFKSVFGAEQEPILAKIDREVLNFAQNLEGALRTTLSGNIMANAIPIIIPVRFTLEDWYGIVARELQALKDSDPDRFDEIMNSHFGMEMQDDPADDPDILNIDLGLDNGEPDTIDYFTGFENRPLISCVRTTNSAENSL